MNGAQIFREFGVFLMRDEFDFAEQA